jgi:hypothetical protein
MGPLVYSQKKDTEANIFALETDNHRTPSPVDGLPPGAGMWADVPGQPIVGIWRDKGTRARPGSNNKNELKRSAPEQVEYLA